MPSRLNELIFKELGEKLHDIDSCVFVDFSGLSGRKAAELRHQLQTECGGDAAFTIVKATLAKRAFADNESLAALVDGPLSEYLAGPTAVAYGADDPIVLVRTLAEWSKK